MWMENSDLDLMYIQIFWLYGNLVFLLMIDRINQSKLFDTDGFPERSFFSPEKLIFNKLIDYKNHAKLPSMKKFILNEIC